MVYKDLPDHLWAFRLLFPHFGTNLGMKQQ